MTGEPVQMHGDAYCTADHCEGCGSCLRDPIPIHVVGCPKVWSFGPATASEVTPLGFILMTEPKVVLYDPPAQSGTYACGGTHLDE